MTEGADDQVRYDENPNARADPEAMRSHLSEARQAPNVNEAIAHQRRQAASEGWVLRDGNDLCPDCAARVDFYFATPSPEVPE